MLLSVAPWLQMDYLAPNGLPSVRMMKRPKTCYESSVKIQNEGRSVLTVLV